MADSMANFKTQSTPRSQRPLQRGPLARSLFSPSSVHISARSLFPMTHNSHPDQTTTLYCDALCAPSWSLRSSCFNSRSGCDLGRFTNPHNLQATRSHSQMRCSARPLRPCVSAVSLYVESARATALGGRHRERRCCRRRCGQARRSSRSAIGNPTEDSHRSRSRGHRPRHSPSSRQ